VPAFRLSDWTLGKKTKIVLADSQLAANITASPRRRRKTINRHMNSGHIYLLKNRAYRNNYHKLGKTTDTVEKRARKLSQATGVPSEFRIVYQAEVVDCDKAENMAKERLKHYRVADTEFFDLPQDQAIQIVMEIVKLINTPNDSEQDHFYANDFLRKVCQLFESGQVRSLSGDALKIWLFCLLSPAYWRESFSLKEFVDRTGIPEDRVIDLLKQLGLETEDQIHDEMIAQEKAGMPRD
jgi:hypothetical protein